MGEEPTCLGADVKCTKWYHWMCENIPEEVLMDAVEDDLFCSSCQ